MAKNKSIFINCPFDTDYWDLFRAQVFTIIKMGYNPRFSLERSDGGEPRISKIIDLIKECEFGIHDLSRCKAKKKGEYFRLNMPLELGIDLGARHFGDSKQRKKKFLILEEDRYRFQAAISDISNSDIKAHGGKPDQVIRVVRDWLVQEAGAEPISPTIIWYQFNDCLAEVFDELRIEGYSEEDIKHFSENELTKRIIKWINKSVEKEH